jgi:VPDSG-CTERM motif
MKNLTKTILAVLATGVISCALFSSPAQATPISGQISFNGVVTFDSTNLAVATTVTHWFDIFGNNDGNANVAAGATGNFAGISGGTLAAFHNGYQFNPSTPVLGLWSVGGFTFNLATSSILTQNSTDLSVHGTGTITGGGFDPTPGNWDFDVSNADGHHHILFAFAASTSTVPDGGSAVALLGAALAGIEILRRKLRVT